MEYTLRDMRIEDYDALIALWAQANLPCRPRGRDSREKIRRELQQSQAIFLVAEYEGHMVGSALGTHDGRKGWINRVAVAPEHQRHGVAKMLVGEVEKRLEDRGIEIVACLIEDHNTVSKEVFCSLGYSAHEDITYFSRRKSPDT